MINYILCSCGFLSLISMFGCIIWDGIEYDREKEAFDKKINKKQSELHKEIHKTEEAHKEWMKSIRGYSEGVRSLSDVLEMQSKSLEMFIELSNKEKAK